MSLDGDKTKEQLIDELAVLRQRVAKPEASEAELKQAEQALRKAYDELDMRVEERTAEFAKINEKLKIDITERKQMEGVLKESEKRFRNLMEAVPIGISVTTPEGDNLELNSTMWKMLGFSSKNEMLKVRVDSTYCNPEERERFVELHKKEGGVKGFDIQFKRRDGTVFWGSMTSVRLKTVDGKTQFVNAIEDITERKQAEEALRESEQKYKTFFENLNDAVFLADVETGCILNTNKQGELLLGRTRKEIIGIHQSELHPPKLAGEYHQRFATHVQKGHAADYDGEVIRKDGSIVSVNISAARIKIGGKESILGLFRDITEHKRVEEALKESRVHLERVTNSMWDAVFQVKMPERVIEWANDSFRLIGYEPEEYIGRTTEFLYPTKSEFFDFGNKLKNAIAAREDILHTEQLLRRKDGGVFPAEITATFSKEEGGITRITSIVRDISERKQAEEREKELQQELSLSARLASVGELAAGVAHEINNPLTGILILSQRLLRKSTDRTTKRNLKVIYNEAQRVANVVESLLTFARRGRPEKGYSDIHEIIKETLKLRSYELKTGNIEVVTDLASDLPTVLVDFQQIQQVFLNIILNAEQVMTEAHGGGKLIIKTQVVARRIRVSFTNDGPGISAEHLGKLFNPFFTTRGEKGGTGLGLSVCHGIITDHGGRIYAKSKLGAGATFFVELPIKQEETP